LRTMQIKSPSKRSLKQNLLVAAIIDVDSEKERRVKDANNTQRRSRSGSISTAIR
jgi:hypothetical protein